MRNFVYVIGSSDDFADLEELKDCYHNGGLDGRDTVYPNYSAYPVSLANETAVTGYKTLDEVATMIARGEAMSDGWCLDDTFSFIMEEQ